MNRTKQKQRKIGEQLFISHDFGKSYELVEGFFNNRREAEEFRARRYPECKYWQVRGLRFKVGFTAAPTPEVQREY